MDFNILQLLLVAVLDSILLFWMNMYFHPQSWSIRARSFLEESGWKQRGQAIGLQKERPLDHFWCHRVVSSARFIERKLFDHLFCWFFALVGKDVATVEQPHLELRQTPPNNYFDIYFPYFKTPTFARK